MSQDALREEITTYIDKTRFAVLAYSRNDGTPLLRSMGSFVPSDFDLYFSTRGDALKVRAISESSRVSFFFEHENQEIGQWKNVLLIGEAVKVVEGPELDRAVALLSDRNPRFRERVAKGELPNIAILRLKTEEVEFLDYGKGLGHVRKVTLQKKESA